MKNIGVRFHDGSEVAYYDTNKVQGGTDEFLRIIRMTDPDGDCVVVAQVLSADVKELFESEMEDQDEQAIGHTEAEAPGHEGSRADVLGQDNRVHSDGQTDSGSGVQG